MRRFKLYAGMTGGFGGQEFQGIYEAPDQETAEKVAYELAVEQYQSYEGYHGIMDFEECYDDCKESGWITDDMDSVKVHEIVSEHYLNQIDSWVAYEAVECEDDEEEDDIAE